MNRRDFIKLTGLAALPLVAPRLVFSADGKGGGNVLVRIFQRGAADGLNMVVPYGEGRYYDLRPTIAIPAPGAAGGALDLDGFFALHPSLAPLLPIYQAGELALIHAAGSPDDSRSHFDAQDYMELGVIEKGLVFDGWLNRHLQIMGTESTFGAVALGSSLPLSVRGSVPALGLASIDGFDLLAPADRYAGLRSAVTGLHGSDSVLDQQASQVFEAVDALAAVAAEDPGPADGVVYPETALGRQLADVAALIRADVGLQVACVDTGGWDHHDREDDALPGLLAELGQALAAFHADLGSTMGRVSVVTMTEFGRRAQENASRGTDHGHGSVMLAMGGGVSGGQVWGEWPGLASTQLNRGDLEVTTDFRTVLADVLSARLGNTQLDAVFPGFDGPLSMGLWG